MMSHNKRRYFMATAEDLPFIMDTYNANIEALHGADRSIGFGGLMKHRKDRGKEYIQAHPHLKKWINVCICCGTWGYKTELPEWLYCLC